MAEAVTDRAAAGVRAVEGLLAISDAARTRLDFRPLDETVEVIAREVAGLTGCDLTATFLAPEPGGRLGLAGNYGFSPEYTLWVQAKGREPHPERFPTHHSYATGRTIAIADVEVDADFPALREGARLGGYRGLVCVPIVSRSSILGSLNGYSRRVHGYQPEDLELLRVAGQLAGVAVETARLAGAKHASLDELERAHELLLDQNRSLMRLTEVQSRLIQAAAEPSGDVLEEMLTEASRLIGRSLLVQDAGGRRLAFAGDPAAREAMNRFGSSADLTRLPGSDGVRTAGRFSHCRLGDPTGRPTVLIAHPAIPPEAAPLLLALGRACAAVAGRQEPGDLALRVYARPAELLALLRGGLGDLQIAEAARVLAVPAEGPLRLATVRGASAPAAHSLARLLNRQPAARTPWHAAVAVGRETVILLKALDVAAIRRQVTAAVGPNGWSAVLRVGVSGVVAGLARLPAALDQARAAAAASPGGVTLFEELGPLGELLKRLPAGAGAEIAAAVLGPLRGHDRAYGTALVTSLGAYLRHQGSLRTAAAELHVHPNTLQLRLSRVHQIAGIDVHDVQGRALLALAIRLDQILRPG